MFKQHCGVLAVFVLLCASFSSVQSGVYRWVDDEGRVHFGDRPPTEQTAKPVTIKTTPTAKKNNSDAAQSAEERRQRQQKLLDVYAEEREEKRKLRDQRAKDKKEQKLKCARARGRYENYQRAGSFYDNNPDGSRRYYTKAEHEAILKRAKEAVKQLCK